MLSGILLTPLQIKEAILSLDNERLPFDKLTAISKQLPTADEVRILIYS
jgi:hypothetical protein